MESIASITYLNYKKFIWKKYHSRTVKKQNVTGNITQRGKKYIFFILISQWKAGKKLWYGTSTVGKWVLMPVKGDGRLQTDGRQNRRSRRWLLQSIFLLAFSTKNVNLLNLLNCDFLSLKEKIIISNHSLQITLNKLKKKKKKLYSCRNSQVLGFQKYASLN